MFNTIVRAFRAFRALRTIYTSNTPHVLRLKEAVLTLKEIGMSENDTRFREAQRVLLANVMAHRAYLLAYSKEQVISIQPIEPCPEKWKMRNLDYDCVSGWGEEE